MQELVLARANQEADRLNSIIRGFPAQTLSELNRWMASENGDVYHYDYFDARTDHFTRLTRYHLDQSSWRLSAVTYADSVDLVDTNRAMGARDSHVAGARDGWVRTVSTRRTAGTVKTAVVYEPFAERQMRLEAPGYFKTESPDALKMTYGQLSDYIEQLQRERIQRRAGHRAAAAQSGVPVRHARHDAARGAVRRHDRPPRRPRRHRHRDRALDRLLGDSQRVQRARRRRRD